MSIDMGRRIVHCITYKIWLRPYLVASESGRTFGFLFESYANSRDAVGKIVAYL